MCSNRWLLKNEGNPSFILKYLEKFKISTLIKKCPGFPGNSWQKEPAKKKRAQIQRTQICSLPPPNATNMEVNLRIVHFVNVENKKTYFFCATVKGGGVTQLCLPMWDLTTVDMFPKPLGRVGRRLANWTKWMFTTHSITMCKWINPQVNFVEQNLHVHSHDPAMTSLVETAAELRHREVLAHTEAQAEAIHTAKTEELKELCESARALKVRGPLMLSGSKNKNFWIWVLNIKRI